MTFAANAVIPVRIRSVRGSFLCAGSGLRGIYNLQAGLLIKFVLFLFAETR